MIKWYQVVGCKDSLLTCSLTILALPSSLAGAGTATARALPATVAVETEICITRQLHTLIIHFLMIPIPFTVSRNILPSYHHQVEPCLQIDDQLSTYTC
jgi:hypothetical protein